MKRERLDQALVRRGLCESRARAQALIAAGLVLMDKALSTKPSQAVPPYARPETTGRDHPWVSRDGIGLAAAMGFFGLSPAGGAVCLDVGASTGG